MGKKRSKTAKQKQAKAANRPDKKFGGVSVKKGGGRSKNDVIMIETTSNSKYKTNNKNNKKRMNGFKFEQLSSTSKHKKDAEHEEFDRQMASTQKRHLKKSGHFTSTVPTFAPATLCIDDSTKSTTQLLQETTTKIQAAGIGGSAVHHPPPSTLLLQQSSLARATNASNTWSATHNTSITSILESNNPYAVLEGHDSDDDDDDDEHHGGATQQPLMFRLAPPTFSLETNKNTREHEEDIDPDL